MRLTDSLRGQLMLWLFPPLALLLGVDTFLAHQSAVRAVNAAYDRSLLGAARAIADGVAERDGKIEVEVPYSAFEMFEAQIKERIYYSVREESGDVLSGYSDLPVIGGRSTVRAEPRFFEADYRGEPIRIVELSKRLYGESSQRAVSVLVAETLRSRNLTVEAMLKDSIRWQLVFFAVMTLLVWWGITRGLRPLERLRRRILAREANDLGPVEPKGVSSEVRQLVDALNAHTARTASVLAAHEQFISNASHQIRTPLAILKTQSELLLRARDQAERDRIAAAMANTTNQTVRLTGQLLSLARAEPAQSQVDWQDTRLDKLVAEVMLEHIDQARAKNIDAGLDHVTPAAALVRGNEILLRELFANLIDNAIRYTPAGGTVTVSLSHEQRQVVANVRDSGAGIPVADYAHVFERFVRLPGNEAHGSGLGLAIARQICELHGASITLGKAELLGGLDVRIAFAGPVEASGPA
jgi:two-component system, OmpR family, sensor histidine kinase TctE